MKVFECHHKVWAIVDVRLLYIRMTDVTFVKFTVANKTCNFFLLRKVLMRIYKEGSHII